MEFHLIQAGAVGRRHEIEQGMAGQRGELFQRYLDEVKAYVQCADELGYAGYDRLRFNEIHLQIGQGYLEKGEVLDELELFASKVMPRFG